MARRAPARWIAPAAALALALQASGCSEQRVDPRGVAEARDAMLAAVAAQLREPAPSLGVLAFEPRTFKDACLEIRRRADCPPASVPGYRLRLTHRGEAYEYRASAADPADVALAAAPDPHVGKPALTWTWSDAPGGCQQLLITADARPVIGWCDGPMEERPWLDGRSSGAEWTYLRERFAPFSRTGDPALVFDAPGGDSATAAWRDAIDRWAALRWSELRAGRSGAAHGRALALHRPVRDRPDSCDVLEVTEYGVAYLGRSLCAGGGGEPGKAVWLSDALWAQLDGWLHQWAAYSDPAAGLDFAGRGEHAPDAADVRRLLQWTEEAMAHVAYTDREAWPSGPEPARR